MPETSLPDRIDGAQRAAILLMSLGEQDAASVMRHMGVKEVQRVGTAMAELSNVSREQQAEVMDEFIAHMERQTALGVGAEDYIRKVMTAALGEEKAGGLIDRILGMRSNKGLEALKAMETKSIAETIRNEHPQIAAIVLSYLDAEQSAEILALLPERSRSDVLVRIARLESIQPHALAELDQIMEKQFAGGGTVKASSVGGVKVAANILNLMESALETQIVERIGELDRNLSQQIQDLMFVFDDLAQLDDRSMQALLREVPQDKLGLALKGAEPQARDKVFKNMSQRAAEMLREDMEARGPVKVADVEAAQKEILATARRLADAGTIMLGGKGDEFV